MTPNSTPQRWNRSSHRARLAMGGAVVFVILLAVVGWRQGDVLRAWAARFWPEPAGWWRQAVFYEVFVRSFADSDGDGIGDFRGLTGRLDYLNDGNPQTTTDLGVTGIWLMPIMPSPSYHGYDVTDYTQINPEYGTWEDFQAFMRAAHRRGIRVVIDLPINHTSVEHPWFKASLQGDPQYADWYIWSEDNPSYLGPWNEEVWHPAEGGRYYYGVFWSGMPDLNYNNPAVTAEMKRVAEFWLKEGQVDGFRIDGAKHLIEDGKKQENTPQTLAWFKDELTPAIHAAAPNALVLGEVWSRSSAAVKYVREGALDLAFNFDLAGAVVGAVKGRNGQRLSNVLYFENSLFETGEAATFLTNHDMNRVFSTLGQDPNRAKLAAAALLTTPGTPFLYYGEEIGLTGEKPDEQIRTPMQWDATPNAGFTTGAPWIELNSNWESNHVQAQRADADSLWNQYRQLIQLRNQSPALQTGELIEMKAEAQGLLTFLRATEGQTLWVVMNCADTANSLVGMAVNDLRFTNGAYELRPVYGDAPEGAMTAVDGLVTVNGFNGQMPGNRVWIWELNIP